MVALLAASVVAASAPSVSAQGADRPWMDLRLSPDQRAALLLRAMTLQEKVELMASNHNQAPYGYYNAPIERLGIPPLRMGDAASGISPRGWSVPGTGGAATAFPQLIGVGATWDPEAARRQADAVAIEARATGHDMILGPNADPVRLPWWGRIAETLGEDPEHIRTMVVPMIDAIQRRGVMANLKHYAAYARENNRGGVNSIVSERALREVFTLAWEDAIRLADLASVMCSFNKINGSYSCQNEDTLNTLLRGQLGFEGFVLSDSFALHETESGVRAGTDMETGNRQFYAPATLVPLVRSGQVPEALIDRSVLRILRTMFRFGLFDRSSAPQGEIPVQRHGRLSRDIQAEAITLLKNQAALPLADDIDEIALIGADANVITSPTAAGKVGGTYQVPVLDGLRDRAQRNGAEVTWEPGNDPVGGANMVEAADMTAVPSSVLTPETGDGTGLTARHWGNVNFQGAPGVTRTERQVLYDAGFVGCSGPLFGPICGWQSDKVPIVGPNPTGGGQSATWEGFITAPATGTYRLGLTGYGTGAVVLDGNQIISMNGGPLQDVRSEPLNWVAGERHRVLVTFQSTQPFGIDSGVGMLQWQAPQNAVVPSVQRAADLAADSDVAVVFVRPAEGENRDRLSLKLPQNADSLISEVAAANPRTVVVVASGGPVTMPWLGDVPGLVWNPYGGQEEGNALAGVLFGDSLPSGHLPITWPRSDQAVPSGLVHPWQSFFGPDDPFNEDLNVGYRGYAAEGIDPLFAFGHGLAYTTFEYSQLRVTNPQLAGPQGRGVNGAVRVRVTNTGTRTGSEVVQVYAGHLPAAVETPPQRLIGWAKVSLRPGEQQTVRVPINLRNGNPGHLLSYWDADADQWVTPTGDVPIMVGSSADDTPLTGTLTVQSEPPAAPPTPEPAPAAAGERPAAGVELQAVRGAGKAAILGRRLQASRGRMVKVRVHCPESIGTACRGVLTATRGTAGSRERIARRASSIPAGTTRTIKLTLTRSAFRELRRDGAMAARLTLRVEAAGASAQTSRRVRILAPAGR